MRGGAARERSRGRTSGKSKKPRGFLLSLGACCIASENMGEFHGSLLQTSTVQAKTLTYSPWSSEFQTFVGWATPHHTPQGASEGTVSLSLQRMWGGGGQEGAWGRKGRDKWEGVEVLSTCFEVPKGRTGAHFPASQPSRRMLLGLVAFWARAWEYFCL